VPCDYSFDLDDSALYAGDDRDAPLPGPGPVRAGQASAIWRTPHDTRSGSPCRVDLAAGAEGTPAPWSKLINDRQRGAARRVGIEPPGGRLPGPGGSTIEEIPRQDSRVSMRVEISRSSRASLCRFLTSGRQRSKRRLAFGLGSNGIQVRGVLQFPPDASAGSHPETGRDRAGGRSRLPRCGAHWRDDRHGRRPLMDGRSSWLSFLGHQPRHGACEGDVLPRY